MAKKKGGINIIDIINHQKASLLYNVIDNSNLYYNDVSTGNRSRMNIPFRLIEKEGNKLSILFLKKAFASGLYALRGHRNVGGMRASIYNAMPLEGVKALTNFMIDFERLYG